MVRAGHLPTTLRTSAISVLAAAADTDSLAVGAYLADLASTMVDLIQVESAAATSKAQQEQVKVEIKERQQEKSEPATETATGQRQAQERDKHGGVTSFRANDTLRDRFRPGSATPVRAGSGAGAGSGTDSSEEAKGHAESVTMDEQPTSTNSKFPPLRRSAIHFLSLQMKAYIDRTYSGEATEDLDVRTLRRMGTVLGYVASTDCDHVVRAMAREAAEMVRQLQEAHLGFGH